MTELPLSKSASVPDEQMVDIMRLGDVYCKNAEAEMRML